MRGGPEMQWRRGADPMTTSDEFDYVIVGAGSAGCVLADRLSADGRHRVCVLEFGGSDRSVLIQMPSALSIPMNMPKYNWALRDASRSRISAAGASHCPRGKVLGGSSSINGLVYVRGNPLDFDGWEEEGAAGWGYRHVLPYFRRAESRQEGGDAWRGGDGPLRDALRPHDEPALQRLRRGGAGRPAIRRPSDINGCQQEGFGRMDMTVKDGVRWSAANAYLKPGDEAPEPGSSGPTRWRRGSSSRAVAPSGVRYLPATPSTRSGRARGGDPGRRTDQLAAAAEALGHRAGARNSPAHGIAAVLDLPGVGENLQDHLEFYFQVACRQPITLYSYAGPGRQAPISCARWLAREGRARRHQPFRELRLHPLARGRAATPTSSTTSCRSP